MGDTTCAYSACSRRHEEHNFVTGEDFGIVHPHSNNSLLFPSVPPVGV